MCTPDLFHVLRSRSTSRAAFDPRRPVTSAELNALLEALRWAPTAYNMQNYEVVAVDDEVLLDEIGALRAEVPAEFLRESYAQLSFSEDELRARRRGLLADAFPPAWLDPASWEGRSPEAVAGRPLAELLAGPPHLVVLYDVTTRAPASAGDTLGLISLGCVLQSVWLAAEALGLSFQVVSAFAMTSVAPALKELLGVPEHLEIAYGARVGHPAAPEPAPARVRREVAELVHHNGYARR